MDVQLGNLIERLRKEGVEEAQQVSEEMLEKARQEATALIQDARQEADKIVEDARREAEQHRENGELALKQAARDSELLLKGAITDLFDRVFKRTISASLTPENMKEMILKIVDQWGGSTGVEIILAEGDREKLEEIFFASLKEDLKKSITIRASMDISSGFRIGLKDENVYYDFTDESVAEVMRMFIQPRLKEILDSSNG